MATALIVEIGSKEWKALIQEGAAEFGVTVGDEAMRGFSLHARELVKFNRKINLTAITDPFEIAVKHLIDSLAAVPYIKAKGTLLDIGSGAGFPGIPIKLVHSALRVTLIDGSARKTSYLKHMIRLLRIDGIVARQCRAEQMVRNPQHRFDFVIARALGPIDKCIRLALPLINEPKGTFIAMRGRLDKNELATVIREINRFACAQRSRRVKIDWMVHRFSLPLSKDQRCIVVLHCQRPDEDSNDLA